MATKPAGSNKLDLGSYQPQEKHKIGLFTLVMISSAFVISVRNYPMEAETGFHVIFFAILAGIGFFLPVGLVSAELATGWPHLGGIFAWTREAFGQRFGFVGVWLQWMYLLVGNVTILYFIGGAFAYIFAPSLANSRLFMTVVLLVIVWGATFYNFRGTKASGKISTIAFLSGVLVPALLIITLGIVYLAEGNPSHVDLAVKSSNIFPDFSKLTTLVLLLGFMRTFIGIEASASHANEVRKPQINYPIAIFIVLALGFTLNVLGSLSVAIVVPQKEISLVAGLMQAYEAFFSRFGLSWMVKITGFLVAFGAAGEATTWYIGPVKGVLASARDGGLPPFLQKVNNQGIPTRLMVVQALVISTIGCLLLMMPNLNIGFWVSNALAVCVYFFMYGLLLLAGIYLRYKEPDVDRKFKIPGPGNLGMWIVVIIGLATLIFGLVLTILPPAQLNIKDPVSYVVILSTSVLVLVAIPFLAYQLRRPSWKIVTDQKQ